MVAQELIARLREDFGESIFASNVIISFILAAVEKIIEVQFACPCITVYNYMFAAAFFVIPAIISFLLVLMVHDCNCPDNFISWLYCLFPPVVWLVLVFLDGRYFVCIMTSWPGTFFDTDNTYLKWCAPTNTTRTEELMDYSRNMLILSQGIGISLVLIICSALVIYVMKECIKNTCCRSQEQAPSAVQLRELSTACRQT